ncbi:MAG: serine hydrolase domain-containing protein [Litorimonas sp.]
MRWSSLICSCLSLAAFSAGPALAADDLVPLPSQSPETPWPTHDWPMGVAVDLSAVLDPIFATDIGEGLGETRAIIVVKNGEIIFEHYRDGFTPKTRHVSWSVAKSLTTTLVGRAVQTGLIASIDDPMPAAFKDGDPRGEISWRHWIQLLDGLDYSENGTGELTSMDAVQMMYGAGKFDQLAYVRDEFPVGYQAGTRWNYSTATFHLVARAVQSLLPGTCLDLEADPKLCKADPKVMSDWVDEVLFDPLGIDGVVEFDAVGTMLGGSNAYMSARDYARFGLFILRDGIWEGQRLLPEGWVDFNRTNPPESDTNVYGGGFWPTPEVSDDPEMSHLPPYDAFQASGREGQLVWMVPSRDLVIVRVGLMKDTRESWNSLFQLAQTIVANVD